MNAGAKIAIVILVIFIIILIFYLIYRSEESESAPFLTSATADSDSEITLKWTSSSNVNTYNIYRDSVLIKTGIASNNSNQITYINTGLAADTYYTYYITSVTNSVESEKSNSIPVKTLQVGEIPTPTPGAPGEGTPQPIIQSKGTNSITLYWSPITHTTTYELVRTNAYNIKTNINLPGGQTTYTDVNLFTSETYDYALRAITTSGTTDWGYVSGSTNACSRGTADLYGRICGNDGAKYWGVVPSSNYNPAINILNGAPREAFIISNYNNEGTYLQESSKRMNITDNSSPGDPWIIQGLGDTDIYQLGQRVHISTLYTVEGFNQYITDFRNTSNVLGDLLDSNLIQSFELSSADSGNSLSDVFIGNSELNRFISLPGSGFGLSYVSFSPNIYYPKAMWNINLIQ